MFSNNECRVVNVVLLIKQVAILTGFGKYIFSFLFLFRLFSSNGRLYKTIGRYERQFI